MNPLTALLDRPAASFTVEQLDALPELTTFSRPGERLFFHVGGMWRLDGCTELALTSAELRNTTCTLTAVGEPDGMTPEALLDLVLPRPTALLPDLAEDARRQRFVTIRRLLVDADEALDEWIRTEAPEVHQIAVDRMRAVTALLRESR